MNRDLEYAKCLFHDAGAEVSDYNPYAFRVIYKHSGQYVFDIWAKTKKGRFVGYTLLNWKDKKYYHGLNREYLEKLSTQLEQKINEIKKHTRSRRLP